MARSQPDPHLANVLYNKLLNGPHRVAAVSRRSGISPGKLYALCEGQRHILASDIPKLYRATRDVELFAQLSGADDVGLVVTEQPQPHQSNVILSGVQQAIESMAEAGRFVTMASQAVSDNAIDHQERDQLTTELDELMRQLMSLRQSLTEARVRAINSDL